MLDDIVFAPAFPHVPVGAALVRRFLEEHPAVTHTLRERSLCVVLVREMRERSAFTHDNAEALAEAERSWGCGPRVPLYVGSGTFSRVPQINVSEPVRREAFFAARPSRGAWAGYVLAGEGGAAFLDSEGGLTSGLHAPLAWVTAFLERFSAWSPSVSGEAHRPSTRVT